jgi:hypothetical protein
MALAWTALGILAAGLFAVLAIVSSQGSRFDGLGARIDAVTADLGSRIDAVGADLGSRIDRVDARLDTVGADLRLEIRALGARLDVHIDRHAS